MIKTYIVTFPILAFANICAKETGAKVHKTSNGNYTLALNGIQYNKWKQKKESIGVR